MFKELWVTILSTVLFFLFNFFLLSIFNQRETFARIFIQALLGAIIYGVLFFVFQKLFQKWKDDKNDQDEKFTEEETNP